MLKVVLFELLFQLLLPIPGLRQPFAMAFIIAQLYTHEPQTSYTCQAPEVTFRSLVFKLLFISQKTNILTQLDMYVRLLKLHSDHLFSSYCLFLEKRTF